MAKVSLRPRQYKRLGRLAAKNPERAERVAGRMVERDTRKERGQEFVKANVDKLVPPTPTMKKGGNLSKAQKGKTVSKKAAPTRNFTKADYLRKDSVPSEMFPGTMIPRSKSNYHNREFDKMFEKPKSAPKKKMKSGGELGMKSVKAGYDKNPGVTRADIIVAAKGKAKYGKKMVKKSK